MTKYTVEEAEALWGTNVYPEMLLRKQRNLLLSETDWWILSDSGVTATAEQLAYRQALRDLPASSTPAVDDNNQLINVTWPDKPE